MLNDQLRQDLTQSLKAKDSAKTQILRLLISALKNEQINQKKDSLDDASAIKVLRREAKKRQDSIEAYTKGNRPELAAQEKAELDFIQTYLPTQLSGDQVRAKVKEILAQAGPMDFGPLMGRVMAALKDQADGQLVQTIVKEELK